MEIASEDVDYCCYRAGAINKAPCSPRPELRRSVSSWTMRDGAGKYGAAGMEGRNGEKCHGAAVSEWLIENNGWRFIVAFLSSGGSTDAGDRILMRAFHHAVQDATPVIRSEVIAEQ